ncbi:PDZ domain-containing protein [Nocardioides caeni]|uniref:PDZ domain-containing protein n=1 Tax=Nocardioides caeni TaxID=574700 RepID=A0A4S8NN48_9ACTN|nr:PDZ domain-containing protein [Nocardioides caeni]THV18288.1 PDZ domain-containing protein [Nocardioides caeni]
MNQRLIAACIAAPLVLILGGLALAVPLPYASYSPGPTFDILGQDSDEAEVIQVDGHEAYYDEGQIRFTTVIASSYDDRLALGDAISRWLDRDKAVVPYDVVHPPDSSAEAEKAEGAVQMTNSQDVAKAIALIELGYDLKTAVKVAAVDPEGPAEGKLLVGDLISKVDGNAANSTEELVAAVQTHDDGSLVELLVKRGDKELTVRLLPEEVKGTPRVGISVSTGFEFPFDITLRVDPTVGGPSAGLMFSLAIYDTLTPGSLTDGATIAGTGELRADGSVGPIGGIQQKIAGAEQAGAELFLVPPDNCADVAGLDPDLRLVRVETMHDARVAIEAWVADPDADLPAC